MGLVDLHCHSTASDGTHPPAELATIAREAGVEVLALTDHDTMAGCAELREAAAGEGVTVIEGLELSCEHHGPGTLHLLVYGPDPASPELAGLFEEMARGRIERGPRILELLGEAGVEISWDEVLEKAGGPVVGKAHIAGVMVDHGHAADCQEAFDRYLRWGRPAYASRAKRSPAECLRVANAAGGVGVLAHPGLLERSHVSAYLAEGMATSESEGRAIGRMEELIFELARCGMRGIEAYYPAHSAEQTRRYLELARRIDGLATGGSDFHGERVKPGLRMGVGYGRGFSVPAEQADALLAEMKQRQRRDDAVAG